MMHVRNKRRAIANIDALLKPNAQIVLSIAEFDHYLDCGNRRVNLYPAPPESYVQWLNELGYLVMPPVNLPEVGSSSETKVATHIHARKQKSNRVTGGI